MDNCDKQLIIREISRCSPLGKLVKELLNYKLVFPKMQTLNQTNLKISLLVALIAAVLSMSCSSTPFYEDCKQGDVILTGLFSIHGKTVNDECDTTLNVQALANAEAMVYAIEQVNKDAYLLPNITLGYRIFDTCGIPSRANAIVFSIVMENALKERVQVLNTTRDERTRVYNLLWPGNQSSTEPIAVVIGPGDSASSVVVASMLQVGSLPQISPSSTSDELNQSYFKTFFRTVPPDSQQAKAISDIIEYFKWTYIAVIGSDSSYGRYGVRALENEAHERSTYCIHSIEYFPPSNYENKIQRIVAKLKKATNVKIIVLWAGGISSIHYVFQESYKQQLFGRTWIAPDGWSDTTSLFTTKYAAVIGGFIGTTFRHFDVPDFEKNLLLLNSSSRRSQDNMWWREFWKGVNDCSQFSWKGCGGKLTNINEDLLSVMRTTTWAYVIDAVQAAAHAIDSVYHCQLDHRNLSQVVCLPKENSILSTNVLRALAKIKFQGLTGSISFNKNGDSLRSAAYNIVNLQFVRKGTPMLKNVGTWDRAFKERLQLKRDLLVWKNGSKVVPTSRCSDLCPPGTRQSPIVACCWECIPCPPGSVSKGYSSTNCTECEIDEKSNHDNTKCEALPLDNLTLKDGRGIGLLVTAGIGVILTLFTLGVFVKYRHTPVVKSSNPELSYVYLFSMLVAFFSTGLLTFGLTPFSCTANLLLSTVYYNVCVSILFLKTTRLLHVFRFQAIATSRSHCFYNTRYQFAVLVVLNLLPVVLNTILLIFEPPLVRVKIVQLQYKILECKSNGTTTGIIIICSIYAYELVLSALVAYYAFRARKLPSNFNETKYIAFIMYIQLTTWGATIAIFTSVWAGSFRTMLYCLVQLCSAYSFLLCIFTPKLYIILRHPEKNTPDYVKATVTRNTMKRSFANSLSGLDLVITSAERSSSSRSETLPTTLSSNGAPASVAKSENTNSKKRVPRRVTWDSHMTINDVITERGVLNNLQIANGIRTSTGHVKGMSLGIPEENTNEETSNVVHSRERSVDNAFCNAAISGDSWKGTMGMRTGLTGYYKPEAQDTRL